MPDIIKIFDENILGLISGHHSIVSLAAA